MHRRKVFVLQCILGKQESKACLYVRGVGGDAHVVGAFCIPPHSTGGNVAASPRKPSFIGAFPEMQKINIGMCRLMYILGHVQLPSKNLLLL